MSILEESSNNSVTNVLALKNIIASMPGHVYWKNHDGVYLGCNDRQAVSLGMVSGEDVVGKTDFDLPWNSDSAQKFRNNDLRIMETGMTEIIEEPAIVDGKPAMVLSQKSPIKNEAGDIVGILGISVDITKQKAMERELIVANDKAKASDQIKSDFIHNMEHDIRTPLTGIYGMINLLVDQETMDDKKSLLVDIALSAKELLDYCDGILDFSKVGGYTFPFVGQSH